jgi:predicted nucleotidyltransferase
MLDRLAAAAKPRPSAALTAHRAQVKRLAERRKATDVRVFGSVARGTTAQGVTSTCW